jgi:hypothetical protein
MATESRAYPLTLRGELTMPPSRGWWLLKWLLAIPHYIILFFLAIAFVVVWIITLFAILFTGKHPKGLFDYKVGFLRWAWRVGFYSYSALGTDKYPPFSLEKDDSYPADLDIPYTEKMSRGLVVIKWWLLAFPHLVITSIFLSGWGDNSVGLIFVLAIFAGVALLFTGKYPESIFKLVIGFNYWVNRVAAYVSLLTDEYPPFRLWDD